MFFYFKTVIVFTVVLWLIIRLFAETYFYNGWADDETLDIIKKSPIRVFYVSFILALVPILRVIWIIVFIAAIFMKDDDGIEKKEKNV